MDTPPNNPQQPSSSQPPSPSAPRQSVWAWLTGKPVTPPRQQQTEAMETTPLEAPSFFERLLERGPHMKQVRDIRKQEHQMYLIQKRRLQEALRRQQFETQKELFMTERKMYGVHGYNVGRYENQMRRMQRRGDEQGFLASQRQAERIAKKANEKYSRLETQTLKKQRQWERQQFNMLKKERDMRIKGRLEDLRMQTKMQNFLDSPHGSLGSSQSPSRPQRRGFFGGLFSK